MTQTTPTKEQIAARLKQFGDPSNDYGIYALRLEKHEAKVISDHIEALAAQLAEAQEDLRVANMAGWRATQKQTEAEAAAASARETALKDASYIAFSEADFWRSQNSVNGDARLDACLVIARKICALKSTPAPVTPSDPNAALELIRNMPVGTSAPVEADGWRPIESAPSGQDILMWHPGSKFQICGAVIGYMTQMGPLGRVPVFGSTVYDRGDATHWRPLPPPPTAREGE